MIICFTFRISFMKQANNFCSKIVEKCSNLACISKKFLGLHPATTQELCPWTPLGAVPPDPCLSRALPPTPVGGCAPRPLPFWGLRRRPPTALLLQIWNSKFEVVLHITQVLYWGFLLYL
mgnify:CR=1 FL=1